MRRPGLFLSVAAAGAVLVNVVVAAEPAAQVEAAPTESVSVADALGLTAGSGPVDATADLSPLEDLVASRSTREAAETAAARAQAAADRAELRRQKAEARAEARAEAAAKAAAEAAEKEAAEKEAAEKEAAEKEAAEKEATAAEAARPEAEQSAPSSSTAVDAVAKISNTAGAVSGGTQSAADAVVSNVPGAGSITIGGTRPSATDPGGHPSGRALDWMVLGNTALGNAIVQYHIANWDALGVDYLIYQQRYLGSPGGSWSSMEDRGSPTQNHMDHVHVNYRG